MLNLRQRVFVISGIAAAIVLSVVLAILWKNARGSRGLEEQGDTYRQEQETSGVSSSERRGRIMPAIDTAPNVFTPAEQTVRQIARLFAERFGTYSNQNGNAHIEDAKSLASARMQEWIDTQKQTLGREYAGVTTEVLVMSVTELDEDAATVEISAQQAVSSAGEGGVTTKTMTRRGTVHMIRTGEGWKVDGFFWEN